MKSARELQKWFESHIADDGTPYRLDKHQAKIVLDCHKNTLVTARAGSGKTRTIVAKVSYLLTYEKIPPEEIIIFAFNRKARAEINERLLKITFDNQPLFDKIPNLATTFHAFAYKALGGKEVLASKMISEQKDLEILQTICRNLLKKSFTSKTVEIAKQFITRSEQQFFTNYGSLADKISQLPETNSKQKLRLLYRILVHYKKQLKSQNLTNFNEIMADAAAKIARENSALNYSYIFVDEYQDFSKLFLNLIQSIREKCPDAHLLAVGDDWQAINRFAGSNVDYFLNFQKYFPENSAKLFIPTNYRSGKIIVRSANFFMSKALGDFNGCKSGNKLRAKIFYKNMMFENYPKIIAKIIEDNPGKSIKLLSRNNEISFERGTLSAFVEKVRKSLKPSLNVELSESTIHRSKGLESDVVILLEIDANKFPSPDKTGGLYEIFGDTKRNLFLDEARLFYVALTRPKEKLYILSKSPIPRKETKKYNFFSYLNSEWLEEF